MVRVGNAWVRLRARVKVKGKGWCVRARQGGPLPRDGNG
jgi:hypothetical protein